MRSKVFFYLGVTSLVAVVSANAQSRVTWLRCEHLTNPLGIDARHPRLSWELQNGVYGIYQTGWQIFLSKDSLTLLKDELSAQISKRHKGSSQFTTYAKDNLKPFTKYYWRVKLWDERLKTALSPIAHFETGMMTQENWKGTWIKDTRDIKLREAPYFRKGFLITKKIMSARAYVAAAGLFELYVNGTHTGDQLLDPMYTRFDRRNLYLTFDITKQLQTGANAVGVILGNGWYNLQTPQEWYFEQAPWRQRPYFCMDIRITYADGTVETICTGKDWKTILGPVLFNSIYTGEQYDARKELPGWSQPTYDDKQWNGVLLKAPPSMLVAAQTVEPIRATNHIDPVSVKKFSDTDYVYDLGRNIAGVSLLKVKATSGTLVKLRHAEKLYPNGHIDQSNIDIFYEPDNKKDRFQEDIYTTKGGAKEETYEPRFTYHGFRFVEVTTNAPVDLTKESLSGIILHSDVPKAGKIESSNPFINQLWMATNNSYLSNLMGYPTDCPQREKNGWTGDVHLAIETGLYNFDGITIYEKWLADLRDEQNPNGMLPGIVPSSGWGYIGYNSPDWLSALLIVPWELYKFYGDDKALKDNYENMKRYIDHLDDIYPDGLAPEGLGDREAIKSHADVMLTTTAYYYNDAVILSKTARVFHKEADYQRYSLLAAKIKNAFNKKFYHDGVYASGFQTENSAALYWGLVPKGKKAVVAANLAKSTIQDSVHLDIGVLGSKTILNALSENGYPDIAYQLATKETFPSWGYWVKQGMTTLPENWNMRSSLNHIFFGEISAWFYKGLGGINIDERQPGFKHILLQPHIVNGLDSFYTEHECPYGKISSGWKTAKSVVTYTVTIPPNTTADLQLDLRGKIVKKVKLRSGTYSWRFKPQVLIPHFHPTVMLTSKDAVVGQGSNR